MNDIREILNTFRKEELIELIIENSDNGYYPLELFLLKADYTFKIEEIEKYWGNLYEKAFAMNEEKNSLCADYLAAGAEMCFDQIKKLDNEDDKKRLCDMMVKNLTDAAEKDGIGMDTDDEWLYLEVRDKIEEYMGK